MTVGAMLATPLMVGGLIMLQDVFLVDFVLVHRSGYRGILDVFLPMPFYLRGHDRQADAAIPGKSVQYWKDRCPIANDSW